MNIIQQNMYCIRTLLFIVIVALSFPWLFSTPGEGAALELTM